MNDPPTSLRSYTSPENFYLFPNQGLKIKAVCQSSGGKVCIKKKKGGGGSLEMPTDETHKLHKTAKALEYHIHLIIQSLSR